MGGLYSSRAMRFHDNYPMLPQFLRQKTKKQIKSVFSFLRSLRLELLIRCYRNGSKLRIIHPHHILATVLPLSSYLSVCSWSGAFFGCNQISHFPHDQLDKVSQCFSWQQFHPSPQVRPKVSNNEQDFNTACPTVCAVYSLCCNGVRNSSIKTPFCTPV